ncbi:MAG: TIGR03643 family protein [Verrucomicrobiota bacterium]
MGRKRQPSNDNQQRDIIGMAWSDRISFEEIEKDTGLTEAEVIRLMRRSLKRRSFQVWRARVSGRLTKHRRLLKQFLRTRSNPDYPER